MRHLPYRNLGLALAFVGVLLVGSSLFVWPYLTDASPVAPTVVVTPTQTVASHATGDAPMCPGSPHCDAWRAGTVTVSVTAYAGPRDPARGGGQTLAYWRTSFGGHEGDVTDPYFGNMHHISLMPWATADPDNTFIVIRFTAAAPRPRP